MARSTRRPYTYWCTGTATEDRRNGNRRLRHVSNQWVRDLLTFSDPDDAPPAPIRSEVDNPWDWQTDGNKQYAGPKACTHWDEEDDARTARFCRK
jgi:hypothetical protein